MTKIVLDDAMKSKFQNLSEPVELWDESGKLLGRYLPLPSSGSYVGLEPPISMEELELRKREKGKGKTYTTAEVIAYLEKL